MDCTIFAAWCAASDVSPFPQPAAAIFPFVDSAASRVFATTLWRRVSALSKAHPIPAPPDPTATEATQPGTTWGLRYPAMLAFGYELLLRRTERVTLTVQDVIPREDGRLGVLISRNKSDRCQLSRAAVSSLAMAALTRAWLGWRGERIVPVLCRV